MDVKPSLAIAIAFVFLVVGGSAFWFTQQGLVSTGPGDIGIDEQGTLYAHYGDKVFLFDANASPAGSVDLKDIGAVGLWGGLSFFPNGDWLIAPEGTALDGRLHRCTVAGKLNCTPLADMRHRFQRTFRTFIANEHLFYLSDSSANNLTAHNERGERVAKLDTWLDRPGEVKRYGNRLAVADVFGLRMVVVDLDPATGLWTQAVTKFKTPARGISDHGIDQPVDFFLHQDKWYVLVKDVTMSRARLHRYTLSGEFIDEVPLPETDMIMAMEKHANAIVLSDFRQARLLRVGLNGEPMPDLGGELWERHRQTLNDANSQNRTLGIALWILFAVLLIAGFVVALRQQSKSSPTVVPETSFATAAPTKPPVVGDPAIHWLQRNRMHIRMLRIAAISLLSIPVLFLVMWVGTDNDCEARLASAWVFASLAAVILLGWPMRILFRKVQGTRLGVRNEWVIAELPDQTVAMSRATDLHYVNTLLFVDNKPVPLGAPNNRLFEKQDFEQHLQPLLAQAQRLGGLDAYRFRWRHSRGGVISEIVIVIIAAIILLDGIPASAQATFKESFNTYFASCKSDK